MKEQFHAVKTGVIGAGAISEAYLNNLCGDLKEFINVKSISASHIENAKKKADKYGIEAHTTEEILNDPEIEMVIILTPVDTHYGLIKDALNKGKHVYTEKTITVNTAQAKELIELSESKGLYLGSAPDTFLGSSLETVKKAIDEGMIGEVNSFSISISRNNDILTSMFPFLRREGAGILRDYVVYYLTCLCALLGPAEKAAAFLKTPYPRRVCILPDSKEFGQEIETPNEAILTGILKLKNGITGTIHDDSETCIMDRADFVIYGTKGMLLAGCANNFGDPVRFVKAVPADFTKPEEPEILEPVNPYSTNCRGLGAAEMAKAVREGRKNRASAKLALHVLDIIEAIERSAASLQFETIESAAEIPDLFTSL